MHRNNSHQINASNNHVAESSLIQSTYPGVLTEEYFTGVGAISGA